MSVQCSVFSVRLTPKSRPRKRVRQRAARYFHIVKNKTCTAPAYPIAGAGKRPRHEPEADKMSTVLFTLQPSDEWPRKPVRRPKTTALTLLRGMGIISSHRGHVSKTDSDAPV